MSGKETMSEKKKTALADIRYVKLVPIGGINPGSPLSEREKEQQIMLLNHCLNDYPKGVIIGRDISVGRYMAGEHEITMEKVTYHVGFERKPAWER